MRFICGTYTVHRALEAACARLVGTGASLSFVSAWNANEAVPATLLGEQDIVISDQLNHASIIDASRLAKAIAKCQTAVYRHADLADLDQKLTAARDRRTRLVITDGVFSMEGSIAPLPDLVELCRRHDAVLMVDDSHATGVLGEHGRGTAEHFGLLGEIGLVAPTVAVHLLAQLHIARRRPSGWSNVWHADPNIPLDVLSCFDPLGNAVHTALSFDLVGEEC